MCDDGLTRLPQAETEREKEVKEAKRRTKREEEVQAECVYVCAGECVCRVYI